MKRIEDLRIDKMSADQLALYKEIVNGPMGAVIGPLKIWLNNLRFAISAQAVGKYARYESSLPKALSELAIITTGRCWSSQFE